jgi:hypothetical protein
MLQLCFNFNKIHDSVTKATSQLSRGLWSSVFRSKWTEITLACEVNSQTRIIRVSRPDTPDAIRFSLTDNFDSIV